MIRTMIFAAVLASCGSKTPVTKPTEPTPVEPTKPETQTATVDTGVTLFDDVPMTLPKGWSMASLEGRYRVNGPDSEISIWVFRREDSGDDAMMIAEAWKAVRPDFALDVERSVSPPPSDGWSRVTQVSYQNPTAAAKFTIGLSRTVGKTTYIHLLDASVAALGRRGAQINLLIGSFEPPGAKEESFAGKTPNPIDAKRAAELDSFIQSVHAKSKVPGIAVAIVANGSIVYSKGFGQRTKGGKPVTPDTTFMIGSVTKSLTTLMMGRQVDAKRFEWNTPVTKVYPAFALGDPELTTKLTMATTVCACTGLPRQDMEMLFEWKGLKAVDRLAELKRAIPTTGFREVFQYSNPLVSAGGFLAAAPAHPKKSLDQAYDLEMNSMFAAMGMKHTSFGFDRVLKMDHAIPHSQRFDGAFHSIGVAAERALEPVRPAGAAWSTVNDMARYILVELAEGSRQRALALSLRRTCSSGARSKSRPARTRSMASA